MLISVSSFELVLLLLCSGRVALELAHVQDDVVPGRTPNTELGVHAPAFADFISCCCSVHRPVVDQVHHLRVCDVLFFIILG